MAPFPDLSGPDGGRIFLRDLRLAAQIGVNPGEQGQTQPISVDIEVAVDDLVAAGRSERLDRTIDYDYLANIIRRAATARHYPLVETLALVMAEQLLAQSPIKTARVSISKPDAVDDSAGAGAEICLHADDVDTDPAPLAAKQISPREPIVVVGGGVAGLTAMLWCWRLGYRALLIEPHRPLGGQLHLVHRKMVDLPGTRPIAGQILARRLTRQFVGYGGRWCDQRLTAIDPSDHSLKLTLGDQTALEASALIVATGVKRRALNVPGERSLLGRGLLSTASDNIRPLAGKTVMVVGGGDGACENALQLSRVAKHVIVVHRGARLSARPEFQTALTKRPMITCRLHTVVAEFIGDQALVAARLRQGNNEETIAIDAALVRVGWVPNTEMLPPAWLNTQGFVQTDADLAITGQSRCFAVGDVRAPAAPSVASAMGDGANAAKRIVASLG